MENISEILRNCPEGTRLYSPTFGYVTLDHTSLSYVCVNNAEGQTLTFMFDGRYTEDGECSLFPSKECRDWSKGMWVQHLVKPGTVVYFESTPEDLNVKSTNWEFYTTEGKKRLISLCDIGLCRLKFASKEQRAQFFNELEHNGYHWNFEKSIVEKTLVTPRSDESLKDEISRFEKQIDSVNTEIGNLEEKRREYRRKISDIQKELRRRDADRWKEKMSQSKHNVVKYSEMPDDIKSDWNQIRETIKDGCYGDPYDGCRGCEKNCEMKARELFMKKYNIIKIIWN